MLPKAAAAQLRPCLSRGRILSRSLKELLPSLRQISMDYRLVLVPVAGALSPLTAKRSKKQDQALWVPLSLGRETYERHAGGCVVCIKYPFRWLVQVSFILTTA